MSNQLLIVVLIGLIVLVYIGMAVAKYVRMRGTRIIICPETQEPAAVTVDAAHAAMTTIWESPDVRLQTCSRWPEREQCNQGCTRQIIESPSETLEFQVLKRWYAGKICALCRRPIQPLQHVGPKPGMLNVAGRETLSWDEIPAEHLPEMCKTHLPVCSSCQVAEAFRRQFPDLVLDRDHHQAGSTVH